MIVGPRAFRDTLGRMPTGVTVITTTARDGEMHGVTIGSFSSLSLEPPLVLFCLDKEANCREAFLDSTCFAVNVLAEDQSALSSIFATKNAPRPWHELDYSIGEASGAPPYPILNSRSSKSSGERDAEIAIDARSLRPR